MTNFLYGGATNVGYQRELNEDYVSAAELDDTTLFVVIADGAGSNPSQLQPASIVASEINANIRRVFEYDKDFLFDNAEFFLNEAMLAANRVLGAFKRGNEELYAGFGASVSCCLLWDDGNFCFAHTGNTRIYLIRTAKDGDIRIHQLTIDQTKAMELYNSGIITIEQYHMHPDRLSITGGLGIALDPDIQTYTDQMRKGDFILMTTDGIHYAIQPNPMAELVVMSGTCDAAADALIKGAISLKYNDNMGAMVIWRPLS